MYYFCIHNVCELFIRPTFSVLVLSKKVISIVTVKLKFEFKFLYWQSENRIG